MTPHRIQRGSDSLARRAPLPPRLLPDKRIGENSVRADTRMTVRLTSVDLGTDATRPQRGPAE